MFKLNDRSESNQDSLPIVSNPPSRPKYKLNSGCKSLLAKGIKYIPAPSVTKRIEVEEAYSNKFREERTSIQTLEQNKDIIKRANKGAAIVVMDKTDYVGEAERQLANQVHHKRLEEPVFPKSIPKINDFFQSLTNRRFKNAGQLSYLKYPEDPAPRRMYLLPKIHKDRKVWPGEGEVPPGRPIIADCGSESYASDEYIDHFLAPLAKQHKSYLKDTNDFINNIAGNKAKEGAFIATIDVDRLYTNIDNTNGLEAVKQIFIRNPNPKRPDKEILERLKINLENNDFEFNSQWYLQMWGTSMSKKFAPNYANLFLAGKSIRKMRPKTLSVLEVPR